MCDLLDWIGWVVDFVCGVDECIFVIVFGLELVIEYGEYVEDVCFWGVGFVVFLLELGQLVYIVCFQCSSGYVVFVFEVVVNVFLCYV